MLSRNSLKVTSKDLEPSCIASLVSTVLGVSNRGLPLTALLTLPNDTPWRNFSLSSQLHAKMGHVSTTTPLFGVIYHPFGKT